MKLHICLAAGLAAAASPAASGTLPAGVSVDATSLAETARSQKKRGITLLPAQTVPVRQGVNKDNIYALMGPPHFGEGITRRWNYVINLVDGDREPVRCRLQIDFRKPEGSYNVVVDRLTWSSEECATLGSG